MADKHKKIKQKSFSRTITRIVLVLFSVVISVNIFIQYSSYRKLKTQEAQLLVQVDEQKQKALELDSKKEYYTSDAYIEDVARSQLGLTKPNEKVFINRAQN